MLISIDDRIIDTEYIYEITPIKGDNCWNKDNFIGREVDACIKTKDLFHNNYYFEIKLYNVEKPMRIVIFAENVLGKSWWHGYRQDYDNYLNSLNLIKSKCEFVRNEIIEHWNKSKSSIPKILTK